MADREYLSGQKAQPIAHPWGGGDPLLSRIADGWDGKPLWGRMPNTWIKYVAR